MMAAGETTQGILHTGTTDLGGGGWVPWEAVKQCSNLVTFSAIPLQPATGSTLIPTNKWVFLALTTNTVTQIQNGFRYTLPSTSEQKVVFNTRDPPGILFDMKIGGTVFIGGDTVYNLGDFWLQYVRMYLNYFPNSEDEMINLAVMETGNIFTLQT